MGFAANMPRRALVQRAMLLEAAVITYNVVEGILSLVAGIIAGSVVLVAFGLDSAIEVSASVVVLFYLAKAGEESQPEWEQRVAQFVGLTLLLVAAYVLVRSVYDLTTHSEPDTSYLGIGITLASVLVMPAVSRLQHGLAVKLESVALEANSRETFFCSRLSAATLLGLAANAAFGSWWADPLAGLVLVYFITREGWEIFHNRELICVD